jgi:predicted transcriptional regulator
MTITSIRLRSELEKPLSEMADKLNRSKNWVINQAIKEYLEHEALEQQRWQETLQALGLRPSGESGWCRIRTCLAGELGISR